MVTRPLVALLLIACGDAGLDPRIDQVAPPVAAPGDRMDLLGEHFCEARDVSSNGQCILDLDAFASFGNIEGIWRRDLDDWWPDRIVLAVPVSASPGETTVAVTVRGRPSLSRVIRIE